MLRGSDHEDREEEYTHKILGFNQCDIAWDKWLNSVKYVSDVICGPFFPKIVREQPIPIQQSVTCVFSVESWLPLQDDTIYALPSVYVAELPINITENGVRHMVQEAFSGTLRLTLHRVTKSCCVFRVFRICLIERKDMLGLDLTISLKTS